MVLGSSAGGMRGRNGRACRLQILPRQNTLRKVYAHGVFHVKTAGVKLVDIEFQAITFSTYGGFGSSAHALINKMTAEAHPYDFDPWARPGPKSHAYLQLGFALARANARMLINADASRRSAHNRVRTSRLRSPT